VRLTAAFALAMLVVLSGAGLFVYLRLRADLNDSVEATLQQRVRALAAGQPTGNITLEDPEESFVQILTPAGRLVDAHGGAQVPALSPEEARRAARGEVVVERRLPGIDGPARVIARPRGRVVVLAGQSLNDRNDALAGVIASFAIGGPVAILLASVLGYLLASAGLAPMDAMRRRAREVSLGRGEDRLPLPAARDEVRRLGETLNEMLERLRLSFERERRFVADASHELRTPIAVVKTELEGALGTGEYGPPVREALVAAIEECDRLAQLAEDLLVIARVEEGELPLRRETLAVGPLLGGVRDQFTDRAEQHGRHIVVDSDGARELSGDPLRLRQALGNLVDNALRHGEGDVVLRARVVAAGIELEVSDHGAGFGEDIADRAFERFARGDRGRTRGGTGLGLAIVQMVAEAHRGRATIVPGDGATVRLWLPDDPALS
jgi:signal transduction histidine kinase